MRLLLIEDDAMIGAALKQALADGEFAVTLATDGRDAAARVERERYDVVVLDLGLPRLDGTEVLRRARSSLAADPEIPIIVISARDALESRIEALDLGADDYLVKPFSSEELLARLRALLRRRDGRSGRTLGTERLALDLARKTALMAGTEYPLSAREFALLRALLVRPGSIFSRSELEDKIYGGETDVESNVVEYIIHGLRKKLGADTIRNVRGLGWFVPRDER